MEEYENKKRKQIGTMRSLLDYGIGTLIMLAGTFFLVRKQFDLDFNKTFPPSATDILFGVVCLLYGAWRIYRGYKKNYFK